MNIDVSKILKEAIERQKSESNELNNLLFPEGTVTDVTGSGGSIRHRGSFTEDNPYVIQMQLATKNQDKDALYERAVEFQADRAQDEWQLAVNRQILEEQREYDSPAAQLARQREAGINPDLVGAAGASAGAGGSSMPYQSPDSDVTAQTKFNNSYDNIDRVFAGLTSVSQFVSGITSSISTVNSLYESLSTFNDRKSLLNSQARTAQVGADVAVATKEDVISSSKLSLASQRIQQIRDICQLLTPKSSDDEIASLLSDLGIPEGDIPQFTKGVKHCMSTPQMQDFYNRNQISANQSEGMLPNMSVDFYRQMSDVQTRTMFEQARSDYHRQHFSALVSRLIDNPSNAQNVAGAEIGSNENAAQQQKILRRQLKSVVSSIDNLLRYRGEVYNKLEAEKQSIINKYDSPIKLLTLQFNHGDIARIQAIEAEQNLLSSMSNADLQNVFGVAYDAMMRRYDFGVNAYRNFQIIPNPFVDKFNSDIKRYTFGSYANPSQGDDGLDLVGLIMKLIF